MTGNQEQLRGVDARNFSMAAQQEAFNNPAAQMQVEQAKQARPEDIIGIVVSKEGKASIAMRPEKAAIMGLPAAEGKAVIMPATKGHMAEADKGHIEVFAENNKNGRLQEVPSARKPLHEQQQGGVVFGKAA